MIQKLEGPTLDALLRDVWKGTLTNAVRAGRDYDSAVLMADQALVDASKRFGKGEASILPGMLLEVVTQNYGAPVGTKVMVIGQGDEPLSGVVVSFSGVFNKQPHAQVQVQWDHPEGEPMEWVPAASCVIA